MEKSKPLDLPQGLNLGHGEAEEEDGVRVCESSEMGVEDTELVMYRRNRVKGFGALESERSLEDALLMVN